MLSENESDRIKEAKAKIKEDAEIRKLKDEAESQALRDKLRQKIKSMSMVGEIFEEIASEIFKGKKPDDFTDDEKRTYERIQKLFEEFSEPSGDDPPIAVPDRPDKEIIRLRIKDIDSGFVDSMMPGALFVIEIDRENKEVIIREEEVDGGYAYIDAEILD